MKFTINNYNDHVGLAIGYHNFKAGMRLRGRIRLVKMIECGVGVGYHETILLASANFLNYKA